MLPPDGTLTRSCLVTLETAALSPALKSPPRPRPPPHLRPPHPPPPPRKSPLPPPSRPPPVPPAPPSPPPPCQICVTFSVVGHDVLGPPSPDATTAQDLAVYLTAASTTILSPAGPNYLIYSPSLATRAAAVQGDFGPVACSSVRVCAHGLRMETNVIPATTTVCNAFGNPSDFPMVDPGVITAHLPQYEAYSCSMRIAVQDSCSSCSYTSTMSTCSS